MVLGARGDDEDALLAMAKRMVALAHSGRASVGGAVRIRRCAAPVSTEVHGGGDFLHTKIGGGVRNVRTVMGNRMN